MLINELAQDNQIRVVERDQLQHLMDEQNIDPKRVDQSTAVRLGKLLGAHHMIFGGSASPIRASRMILNSRAVNVETSQVEYVARVQGNTNNVLTMITQLADTMINGMKLPALDTRKSARPTSRPPRKYRSRPSCSIRVAWPRKTKATRTRPSSTTKPRWTNSRPTSRRRSGWRHSRPTSAG